MLTSEEKRATAREEIMEDGSIFNFVKSSDTEKDRKSNVINNKQDRIDSFKKVLVNYIIRILHQK